MVHAPRNREYKKRVNHVTRLLRSAIDSGRKGLAEVTSATCANAPQARSAPTTQRFFAAWTFPSPSGTARASTRRVTRSNCSSVTSLQIKVEANPSSFLGIASILSERRRRFISIRAALPRELREIQSSRGYNASAERPFDASPASRVLALAIIAHASDPAP